MTSAGGHQRTIKRRSAFLDELAKCGNVSGAAEAAGIARSAAYEWRAADADFAAAWDNALEEAADVLEREAVRRAVQGVEKYITSAKGLVYGPDGEPLMERTYSDTLLIFLLKGARPTKYRDNAKVEHSGQVGVSVAYVNDWRGGGEESGDGE